MAVVQAKITLPWTSGLPEDVTVTTLHFMTASSPPDTTELDTLDTEIPAIWNTSSGVAGNNLGGYLSNLVSRVASACTIDYYDLADAEPRIPLRTTTWTMGAADEAASAPTEIALCLSFQGDPESGVNQARRRNRIFLGPWNISVLASTGRPSTALRASVAAAGNFLHDTLNVIASDVLWITRSPTLEAINGPISPYSTVTNGWCDDEWDVLRSRGRRATARDTFS